MNDGRIETRTGIKDSCPRGPVNKDAGAYNAAITACERNESLRRLCTSCDECLRENLALTLMGEAQCYYRSVWQCGRMEASARAFQLDGTNRRTTRHSGVQHDYRRASAGGAVRERRISRKVSFDRTPASTGGSAARSRTGAGGESGKNHKVGHYEALSAWCLGKRARGWW